jgi:hypothetical protein
MFQLKNDFEEMYPQSLIVYQMRNPRIHWAEGDGSDTSVVRLNLAFEVQQC